MLLGVIAVLQVVVRIRNQNWERELFVPEPFDISISTSGRYMIRLSEKGIVYCKEVERGKDRAVGNLDF